MTRLLEIIFWFSLGGVVYCYALYPVLIWACSKAFGSNQVPTDLVPDVELPTVSLLIAAYNEERVIGDRLINALSLDYPADKLEIVIASDGSSDNTTSIVRGCRDSRVRLIAYPERQGKAAVLNAAFKEVRGGIVVLSDANTHTHPAAVRHLVRWFSSPDVGVVCGRLILTDPTSGTNVDGVYWRYETFLKHCEARLGSLLGANGAIYAIRRELYPGIRRNTLIDDFVIPLVARIRHRCRIEYDDEAIVYEETPEAIESEFKRRARIGTGGFQSLPVLWPLLSPRWGWTAFAFWSHKVLRWLCPFFLIGALAANIFLFSQPFYRVALALQAALYLLALVGKHARGPGIVSRLLRLLTLFTGMNLALLVGFWRWITTEPQGAWARTAR